MPYADPEKARECYRLAQARYRQRRKDAGNPEPAHTPEYMAAYYAANREKMIERSSKRNAALAAAGVRRLSQAQISAQNAKRKAARRGMNGSHTAAELDALMVFQGHLCTYCRIDLRTVPYHADHKTPLARGGSNDIGNMQMLCAPCNMRKHATTHEEFLMRLALDAARRNHADPEAIELLPVGMAA